MHSPSEGHDEVPRPALTGHRTHGQDPRLSGHRASPPASLRRLVSQTRTLAGEGFLRRLVEGLSNAFGGGFAEVALLSADERQLVADICYADGAPAQPITYEVAGTPCAHVLTSDTQHFARGLRERFPDDAFLADEGYDSYLGSPMFDASGRPTGLVSVLSRTPIEVDEGTIGLFEALATRAGVEIERSKAVAAKTETEMHFREMVDVQTEMVCRFLPDGTVLFINRAYCEMFGVQPEDLVGKRFAPVIHPDDVALVDAQVAQIDPDNPRVTVENRVIDRHGKVRWTQWTNLGIFDPHGRLLAYQSAGRDVTQQKLAQEQLKRQEESFRFLAEFSSTLGASLDLEATLDQAVRLTVPNMADASAILHFADDGSVAVAKEFHVDPDLACRLSSDPLPLEGEAFDRLLDAIRSGRSFLVRDFDEATLRAMHLPRELEERVRMRTLCSYIIVPLGARGRSFGALFLMTSRNHSNRTYTESDLQFAEALGTRAGAAIENARLYEELLRAGRQKDEFLAMLAHELRNPMAAVTNALAVLGLNRSDDVNARALEIAKRQARQQTRLIDDLLDVSRLTRGKITLQKQRLAVARTLSELGEARREAFEDNAQHIVLRIVDLDDAVLDADPARFEQIIANLLDNAGKYTPPGGTITLHAEREDGQLVIRVEDDGEGIEPHQLHGIFDMFQQAPRANAASSGLGIGLTVVRQLVRAHGGSVSAHSDGPGRGSTFTVRLPLAPSRPDEATPPSPAADSNAAPTMRRRVLVVDDNIDAASTLEDVLLAWQQEVFVVHDGASAVRAAVELAPDLALIDIAMPGMDGYETAQAIRKTPVGQRIRLVALTGFGQPADVQRAREAQFDHHLTKPARLDALRRLLDDAESC